MKHQRELSVIRLPPNHLVMPDHTPSHEDPASYLQGHAFSFGYNIALIQAVTNEA